MCGGLSGSRRLLVWGLAKARQGHMDEGVHHEIPQYFRLRLPNTLEVVANLTVE